MVNYWSVISIVVSHAQTHIYVHIRFAYTFIKSMYIHEITVAIKYPDKKDMWNTCTHKLLLLFAQAGGDHNDHTDMVFNVPPKSGVKRSKVFLISKS